MVVIIASNMSMMKSQIFAPGTHSFHSLSFAYSYQFLVAHKTKRKTKYHNNTNTTLKLQRTLRQNSISANCLATEESKIEEDSTESPRTLNPAQEELAYTICNTLRHPSWESSETMISISNELDPLVVSRVLRFQEDANIGLRFFKWAGSREGYAHNPETYSAIFTILVRAKMFDEARAMMEEIESIKGFEIPKSVFNVMVKGYGYEGMISMALEMFQKMKNLGHKPSLGAFNAVMKGLVQSDDLEVMQILHQQMEEMGIHGNKTTYSHLIRCMCSKLKAVDAAALLYDMINWGIKPDIYNYTIVISALCKDGNIDKACEIVELMRNNGCNPNGFTYNAIIRGLYNEKRPDLALEWLQKMEQDNIPKDSFTYSILIDGLCKSGFMHKAKEVFLEASAEGQLSSVTCNCMLRGYLREKNDYEAMKLYDKMREVGCMPDGYTYRIIIGLHLRHNEVLEALSIYHEMKKNGNDLDTPLLKKMAKGLCRVGRHEEGCGFYKMLREKGVSYDASDYYLAINAFATLGEMDDAIVFLNDMIDTTGRRPNVTIYDALLKGLCKQKRLREAHDMLNSMIEHEIEPQPATYNILIKAYISLGQLQDAEQLYDFAMQRGIRPSIKPVAEEPEYLLKEYVKSQEEMVAMSVI